MNVLIFINLLVHTAHLPNCLLWLRCKNSIWFEFGQHPPRLWSCAPLDDFQCFSPIFDCLHFCTCTFTSDGKPTQSISFQTDLTSWQGSWLVVSFGSNRSLQCQSWHIRSAMWCILIFDFHKVVHHAFVPLGQPVNADFYCNILRHLRLSIWQKTPELWCVLWCASTKRIEKTGVLWPQNRLKQTSLFIWPTMS